ncbi:sugar transferase [Psychrosphaera algicola]|uniref:Sugar transferase n=1 Tax=Psychrosphaera algicola TaxID=3023714 RepID=A0ABT5FJI1_9GAMM|nr:sugar transferase [Psychrosphaera sp. G1-22]MDC2891354.1 sugar transferase [Psychrosphaera sp. G1-22]
MLFSPIILLVSIFIKVESKGPIFFRQIRVGKREKHFKILKFRSMYHSSINNSGSVDKGKSIEEARKEYQSTKTNDSRITKVGKFIRKYYIDELPQFWNVFVGDMSLVGPRPDTPVQEVDYSKRQWQLRNKVRPGITGLAQLSIKHSKFGHDMRINMDIFYVKKYSFCMYFYIILKTILHVVKGSSY